MYMSKNIAFSYHIKNKASSLREKVSVFVVLLVGIQSKCEKCGPEKLRIRTLFTHSIYLCQMKRQGKFHVTLNRV